MSGAGRVPPRGFAVLLRLYPRSFRERFGRAMSETFAEELADKRRRGRIAVVWLWARAALSAVEARAEAVRRFGEIEQARLRLQRPAMERERRMPVREWLTGWSRDVAYAARALSRDRLPALVIVLTLALGLGANTIMFGIVDQLLLRGPAHVVAPEQVRRVYVTQDQWTGYGTSSSTGYITYTLLRDNTMSFEGVAAYRMWRGRIGSGESAREVPVGWSTADMFPLLGVRPQLGRFYTAEEDRPRAAVNVAVLDHGFWQSEYGGTMDVLGRSVFVDDLEYTIIGVAPPGFTGPELEPVSIWLPLSTGFKPHPEWPTTWNAIWLHVITRTRPSVSLDAAAADATRAYRAGAEGHSASAAEGVLSLRPLHYGPTGEAPAEAKVARWLLGVSLVVLLIAVANVMNLLLARMLGRRREIAVRLALGSSRVRLVRLLLSESLLLAFVGLAGALVLAYWGGQAIRLALLPDVQWGAPLGERTLLFAAAATVMTGLLIGLAPALHSWRHDLTRGLRARAGETGGRRAVARGALTIVQAAFSVVLLVGAGLFVRSLWNVSRMDLGIDAGRVLAMSPALDETTQRDAFLRDAIARLQVHPGVERAALALGTPLQGQFGVTVRVPGRDSIPTGPTGSSGPLITAASPGYFETVGTRILRGRGFEEGEGAGTEPVVVVNETMANALWPGHDALTQCLLIGDESRTSTELFEDVPCARVIGIAENAHHSGIFDEAVMQYYVPYGQERGIGGTQIVVRPRGDAIAFIPELRHVLHTLDPGVRYLNINPLQRVLDPQIRPWRLGAAMFLVFGCLALLIAGLGLYSVMAYSVTQRRAEIGVRMALGARARRIVTMTIRQGVVLVLIGVLAGSALALASGPLIEPLLFQTRGRDAPVVGAVAMLLAVVAVLASIIPAARAARMDPMSALRVE